MKTAPATTAANATRRVTIRAGRDTSHHLASSRRRAHATGPAAMSPELCGPEVSSGPDLAIVRLAWATWEALNDEIVMIRASIAGSLQPLRDLRLRYVLVYELVVTARGACDTSDHRASAAMVCQLSLGLTG